ncbi:cytochrome b-c1 complex subunit 6, mitochondrial [Diutina catenulata]
MSLFKDLLEMVIPVAHADEEEPVIVEKGEEEDAAVDEAIEEEDEEDEDEDDEDDEEELEDPLETMREDVLASAGCKPYTDDYEACAARVQAHADKIAEMEANGEDVHHMHDNAEDCVEEFFAREEYILHHVAPKLFHKLK